MRVSSPLERIVGYSADNSSGEIALFQRNGNAVVEHREEFHPFILANHQVLDAINSMARDRFSVTELSTDGFPDSRLYDRMISFPDERTARNTHNLLLENENTKPFLDRWYDTVTQFLLLSGQTSFAGMDYSEMRRMQLDIQIDYEHQNNTEISARVPEGSVFVLKKKSLDALIEDLSAFVQRINPDVIEVFDMEQTLGWLFAEADKRGTDLLLGREGKISSYRQRNLDTDRFHPRRHLPRMSIQGREVIDLYIALYALNKNMGAFRKVNLDTACEYFGISPELRKVEKLDEISRNTMLAPFFLAQLFPLRIQDAYRIGTANVIDHFLLGEYLRQGRAIPMPTYSAGFKGGRTEIFFKGLVGDVHKVDVREMYPSIIKVYGLSPKKEPLGKFIESVELVTEYRQRFRQERNLHEEGSPEYRKWDAVQTAFKRLAATHFGYMGSGIYHFNAPDNAGKVTSIGREMITRIEDKLRLYQDAGDIILLELDTDGIYFALMHGAPRYIIPQIVEDARSVLPEGISLEYEGPWDKGFFSAIKNYALVRNGAVTVKGVGLRGKQNERFINDFIREAIGLFALDEIDELKQLVESTERMIMERDLSADDISIERICRISPEEYLARKLNTKIPQAHMELMLQSSGRYGKGDTVSYFVSGDRKAPVYKNAMLAEDFSPEKINVPYYLALFRRKAQSLFSPESGMSSLDFSYVFLMREIRDILDEVQQEVSENRRLQLLATTAEIIVKGRKERYCFVPDGSLPYYYHAGSSGLYLSDENRRILERNNLIQTSETLGWHVMVPTDKAGWIYTELRKRGRIDKHGFLDGIETGLG